MLCAVSSMFVTSHFDFKNNRARNCSLVLIILSFIFYFLWVGASLLKINNISIDISLKDNTQKELKSEL